MKKYLIMFIIFVFSFAITYSADAQFDAINADIASDVNRSNAVVTADFDGDGDVDVYVSNKTASQNYLWMNDGTGSFISNNIFGDLGNSQRPSVGDIDGDGDLDIYTINDAGLNEQNKLWINDGSGNFTANNIVGDLGSSWDSAMFDMDSDGDLDIYLVNHHSQQNKVWINDGTGNFIVGDIAGDTKSSGHVISFDADGDGDIDMYVGEPGQNKLWINDGAGNFTANDIVGDTIFTYGGAAGDVDGDGDLDLYVTTWLGLQNHLWINDGTGAFTASNIPGDFSTSRDAIFEDLDLDGDLDIYLFVYGDQNKIWINDGSGSFTAGTPIAGDSGNTFSGAFADFEGDGFVDLYSANNGQNKVWLLNAIPQINITAPTMINTGSIVDTTIQIIDEKGVLAADVLVDAGTTAIISAFVCVQVTSTQVDCTISIDSSGDLVIVATDDEFASHTNSKTGYIIDTTPPSISVFIDTITIDVDHPIFTFSGTDDVAVDYFEVTYNTDNVGPGIGATTTDTPVVSPLTLTLDPDEILHTVTFVVYDTAGNSNTKVIIFPPVINFTTPTLISNVNITDATMTISTPTGNDIHNIILAPGTTGASLGICTGSGGDLTIPYAQPVTCIINSIGLIGTITVTAEDFVNGAVGQNDQMFIIDITDPVVIVTQNTMVDNGAITDTTIKITDDYSVLVTDISVDGATTAVTSGFACIQTTATQVDCTISIDGSGDIIIIANDEAGNTDTDSALGYIVDTMDPLLVISAPTKTDITNSPITDTTIQILDDYSVLLAGITVDPATTASYSGFSCVQTSSTQVDCVISLDSSGDLYLMGTDALGNSVTVSELGYSISLITVSSSSSGGGGIRYICKDVQASNYNDSSFGRHKDSLCKYESTNEDVISDNTCLLIEPFTDSIKGGDRDNVYSIYNNSLVTQVHTLQMYINNIFAGKYELEAAGPADGIFGYLTERGVQRLQLYLNQFSISKPLVTDGIFGPLTRTLTNETCK